MAPAADQSLVDAVNAALARCDADLIALIDAALLRAPDSPALLLADAEARFRPGLPDPLARLDAALTRQPGWVEGQRQRAALAWEGGAGVAAWDGFRKALVAQP